MSYWFELMQDDCYLITQDGWVAKTYRVIVESKGKTKKQVDKGWTCDLVPKELVTNRFFKTEKEALEGLEAEKETIARELIELEEEHSCEDGIFAEMDKVNKANVNARLKELKAEQKTRRDGNVSLSAVEDRMAAEPNSTYETTPAEETKILDHYLKLLDKQTAANKKIKEAEAALDKKLYTKYPSLTEVEVKTLVVEDKWMQTIEEGVKGEIDHISQSLTNRVKELAERYEEALPEIDSKLSAVEAKVNAHLQKMGFVWN